MTNQVDLLCLANSKKHGGRCVAGIDISTGNWIRPVSELSDGKLLSEHYTTADGVVPAPLDLIRIYLESPVPEAHHPENWQLTDQKWLRLKASETLTNRTNQLLNNAIQTGPELFGNTYKSVSKVSVDTSPVTNSLALIYPENPRFYLKKNIRGDQLRATFTLNGAEYDLPITDIQWEQQILSLQTPAREQTVDELASAMLKPGEHYLFTISLGSLFKQTNQFYKLVAAVIPVAV